MILCGAGTGVTGVYDTCLTFLVSRFSFIIFAIFYPMEMHLFSVHISASDSSLLYVPGPQAEGEDPGRQGAGLQGGGDRHHLRRGP